MPGRRGKNEKWAHVYSLTCTESRRVYIGSTGGAPSGRRCSHLSELRRGKHINAEMQADFDKYGEDSFEFKTLEQCLFEDRFFIECVHMAYATKADPHCLYNVYSGRGKIAQALTRFGPEYAMPGFIRSKTVVRPRR